MITNYGELQAAIKSYLYNRKDLDAQIQTFISLSEKKMFRLLRAPENERLVQTVVPDGQSTPSYTEPDDYLELKFLTMDGNPLTRISDLELKTRLANDAAPGFPSLFGRVLKEYIFWRVPDSNYTLDFYYWTDFSDTPLVDDADTNAILLEYPDLYLYGALLEAMPFLVDDARIGTWSTFYISTLESANAKTVEQEYSGSPVSVSAVYGDR